MLDLPLIIENCVDEAYADTLARYVRGLAYRFVENVNGFLLKEKPTAPVLQGIENDISVFVAGIYNYGQPRPDMLMPLIESVAKKLGIDVGMENLIRIKANILPPLITKAINRVNLPHTDTNIPHLVFLYYVNDCDGDTVFFNKNSQMSTSQIIKQDDLAITRSVTPKRNTMLVFDGAWYHSSTVPTQDYRMVININLSYPGRIKQYADPASWGVRRI